MQFEDLPSISEIYGEQAKEVLFFLLFSSQSLPSLWIERYQTKAIETASSLQLNLESMYIVRAESLSRITSFLRGKDFHHLLSKGVKLIIFNRLTDYLPEEEINSFLSLLYLLKTHHILYKVKFFLVTDCISQKRSFFQSPKILPVIASYRWLCCIPSRILIISHSPQPISQERRVFFCLIKPRESITRSISHNTSSYELQ